MKNQALLIISSLALLAFTGCKTANPTTGVQEFDPVKTEQVKAVITPVTSGIVRRVILNNPKNADEIGNYMRAVGGVFCSASETGKLGPEQIIEAMDSATLYLQGGVAPEIIDGKNLLIALYRINYGSRFTAELPPDQWPKNVADVICESIDQGLKDAGQTGTR